MAIFHKKGLPYLGPLPWLLWGLFLAWWSISSTKGAVQAWGSGGTAPVSLVNVTCIPKQCLVLGWLGGSLLAGDQYGEQEGELPDTPISSGSFWLWDGMSMWPSIWRLAPDIWSSKSLDLVAIDMMVVAMNWNSRTSHTNQMQRPLQEMKKPPGLHWPCLFQVDWDSVYTPLMGIPHRHGDTSYLGKGSHLPPWTTGFWQFKGWSWSVTAPTAKPDLQDSSTLYWAHPGTPEMWQAAQGH